MKCPDHWERFNVFMYTIVKGWPEGARISLLSPYDVLESDTGEQAWC